MYTSRISKNSIVSKRDTLMILICLLLFCSNAFAGKKEDPRSKTEGQVDLCIDCVVSSQTFGSNNFGELRDVAIFSKSPNSFVDPREVLDRQANPQLNAIGLVKVSGNTNVPPRGVNTGIASDFKPGKQAGIGSGFLINECLVVTNHHVAYLARNTGDLKDQQIEFMAGASGNPLSPFAVTTKGTIVAHGDYKNQNDKKNDWAIIKLEQPVADPNNPNDLRASWRITPVFAKFDEAVEDSVKTASFYQDSESARNGTQLWGQKSCELWGTGQGQWAGTWGTDCAGIPGTSGSPIMTEKKSGDRVELFSYGIMQSVRSDKDKELKVNDSNMNNMVPFSEMMTPQQLEKIIKDNPCVKTTRA